MLVWKRGSARRAKARMESWSLRGREDHVTGVSVSFVVVTLLGLGMLSCSTSLSLLGHAVEASLAWPGIPSMEVRA